MAELPYVVNTGKIPEYFAKIHEVQVPDKATVAWVKSVGFSSSNDTYLAGFLKRLGFADSSGVPTQAWKDYRDAGKSGTVLAAAIRTAYPFVFSVYEDGYRKDQEAIRNLMKTADSSASTTTVQRATDTFRALCKLADFGDPSAEGSTKSSPTIVAPPIHQNAAGHLATVTNPNGVTINLNVELQLPVSASAEDYDNFFAAMRKHLIDGPSEAN